MMKTVIDEIRKLRKGAPLAVDTHNSCRYRLVVNEDDGSKTAYYFSAPVYNSGSGRLLDCKFRADGNKAYLTGSNSNITVSDRVTMESSDGRCSIDMGDEPIYILDTEVHFERCVLFPTTNGVALKCAAGKDGSVSFDVEVGNGELMVRSNDRYFALMAEQFKPFVTFSCIGKVDASGRITAPCRIEYERLSDTVYKITVSTMDGSAGYCLFEVNFYESKLFQDTTVESKNPSMNNAFGTSAFIGSSLFCGEQWLYSRPDFSRMPEIEEHLINKAILHLPKLDESNVELSAYRVTARFCSFGSSWDSRIGEGAPISDSETNGSYQSIDLTKLLVSRDTGRLLRSDGLILKPRSKGSGCSAVSTADSCFAPQILEINYKS